MGLIGSPVNRTRSVRSVVLIAGMAERSARV